MRPRGLVLDANALLMPFQFRMNLDKEIRRLLGEVPVFVPSSVLGELARSTDKNVQAALSLARKYQIVETELSGDEAVQKIAAERSCAVLTNDRELIDALREQRIPVVRMRAERYLVTDDF